MSSDGSPGVSKHGPVDGVRQVALEDPHGLSAGMAIEASLVVDASGARFEAKLDHRDPMDDGVEAPVAAA